MPISGFLLMVQWRQQCRVYMQAYYGDEYNVDHQKNASLPGSGSFRVLMVTFFSVLCPALMVVKWPSMMRAYLPVHT